MMMIIIDNTLLHYYYDSYYYYHHYYYSTTATTMTASITTTISAVILSRFSRHGHSLPVYPTLYAVRSAVTATADLVRFRAGLHRSGEEYAVSD